MHSTIVFFFLLNLRIINMIKQTVNKPSKTCRRDNEEQLEAFIAMLYGLVPKAVTLIEEMTATQDAAPSVSNAVRSILLGRAGRGYEPTYQHAIRQYVFAFKQKQKWEKRDLNVSEDLRSDSIASWNNVLRDRLETLKILQVEIIDVEVGDRIDEDLHAVNQLDLRETESEKIHTVAEVHSPAFRWRDELGQLVTIHAEVIGYCKKTLPLRNGSSKKKSSRRPR